MVFEAAGTWGMVTAARGAVGEGGAAAVEIDLVELRDCSMAART
jgi:hypothetical protein